MTSIIEQISHLVEEEREILLEKVLLDERLREIRTQKNRLYDQLEN